MRRKEPSPSSQFSGVSLKALKDDKRLIVSVAGKAEKAVQYILGEMASTVDKDNRL